MPSSSSRRPPQPVRRPKVAGLRRPSPSPRPRPRSDDAPGTSPEAATGPRPDRPSPRPKSRDAGVPKPVDFGQAEAAAAVDEPERGGFRERPRNPFVPAGALFVLALVLAGLAWWFKIEDNRISAATSNTALLDVARTAQVAQAATSATEALFSYDYHDIAKTQNAAKDLLLNDEVRQKYASLMGDVQRLAPQQKIVVTVKASRSAVTRIEGDLARVMIFVDQTSTRTDQNQTSSGSAQLWLNMQFVDGKWKVAGMDTYNTEQPSAPATTTGQAPASASPSTPASR
ncbi:hypothetical protein ORV05_30295 [Amycolatopsis cynarae]|uniref:Mce-associated membrane protein n=1 Tax=Amycolatopsis cynarae TaxID=2995223 RepID=A0ABY7AYR2_9PSEU|nr:hypothetical protein [Amycolatopsis sp. HUAS 11-8]WAL65162.1 hypothetical protein ORV05_30295 [Amycolatopsis sp. HUAS 11-8]